MRSDWPACESLMYGTDTQWTMADWKERVVVYTAWGSREAYSASGETKKSNIKLVATKLHIHVA